MGKTIGINFGSYTTTVYLEGEGVILREPNAVAVDAVTLEPIAIGQEAINIAGKTPGAVNLITHIYQGNVSDYDRMANLIKCIFKKIGIRHPSVIFTAHGANNTTDVEIITSMLQDAGAKEVYSVDLSTANVMGAGLPLNDSREILICDIGAANTEIGIVRGCATKLARSVGYGCNTLDAALCAYVKNEYNAKISDDTARTIRETVGSLHPNYDVGSYDFIGQDIITGLPCELAINSAQTMSAMKRFGDYLCANLSAIVKKLPDSVLENVRQRGIILTGGGSLDGGIKDLIEETLGIEVNITSNVSECTVNGLGMIIENRKVFEVLLHSHNDE